MAALRLTDRRLRGYQVERNNISANTLLVCGLQETVTIHQRRSCRPHTVAMYHITITALPLTDQLTLPAAPLSSADSQRLYNY